MKIKMPLDILEITDPRQRKALSSPTRLEIIGLFGGESALSVADIAEKMGRPATALYYHVNHLFEIGLLYEAGHRLKGKRDEVLYLPVARRFEIDPGDYNSDNTAQQQAIETISIAQRMALSDMRWALQHNTARYDGQQRNCLGFRLHARLDSETLARLNQHLDEIVELLTEQASSEDIDQSESQYCSLTLALMPLKGRQRRST